MVNNYPIPKKLVSLIFLLFSITAFSQTAGDFRSKATGSWTTPSSWETYNGISWANATSYPGQNAGTGAVLIQYGHTITLSSTITTQNFGEFTIAGRLVLNGDNSSGGMNFSLNTPKIYVTPSPNGGFIEFNNKINLRLPETASFIVSNGGLDVSSGCSANQIIYIGVTAYSKCNGGGSQLPEFADVMQGGGTLSANPTSNSPVCIGNLINLIGGYTGVVGTTTSGGASSGVNYAWEITYPDNSLSLSTNKDLSISATQIGIYSAKLTSTTYFGVDLFTNYKSISVSVNTNTWNGSLNEDWNNPANWSCGEIPIISTDVLIPTNPTGGIFPKINVEPAASGYVKNIVFESGTTLIIENNSLFVAGNMTLNGKIDLNNEAQLVQGTVSILDGTGTIEIDQQGTSDNYRFNYWGSPVNTTGMAYTIAGVLRDGTDPNAFPLIPITFGAPYGYADVAVTSPIQLSTYWMYKYTNLGIGYNGWTRVGKDGNLNVGEGFTMKGSNTNLSEQNYTFVGMPNNGDINLTISANNDYLIGNPYPSALDAKEFIRDNISAPSGYRTVDVIDGNLYFWDHFGGGNHLLKSYEGGYGIVNLTGEIEAMATDALINNTGNTSTKIPPKFIPVAQGFFVTAVSGIVGAENIQFKNSQRLFKKENSSVSQFMKSAKYSKSNKAVDDEDKDAFPKIYLKYSSPKGFHRQILVGFIENTNDGVDIGYDAINNETFAEDMAWRTNNINFIIQAVPTLNDQRILPLEVKVAVAGVVKISIDKTENIPSDTEIFIKDNTTGEMHNISNKPFEIELTAGKYTGRFALTFKTQKLVSEDLNAEILTPAAAQPIIEGIHVFMNNALGELQIKNNSTEEIVSVALINAVGQTLKIWNSNFNIRTISLPISTATGVYLVQINTKTGKTVKKISVE